jgi:malate dehydrogenase (oxaloacetate-decarboxylating)
MTINEDAIEFHKKHKGKLNVTVKFPIESKMDLSLAYTPGVAAPCLEIAKNKELAYDYCIKGNTVAVISDGSSVLGLGNIGPEAGLPVMEGKAALFKAFANIDAFPLCVDTQDPDEIIKFCKQVAPTFGGINLEDIGAPKCFEIEAALQDIGIPVMHDDQHGTAIVALAAIINALKVTDKKIDQVKIVMNGAGAAGTAICKLLLSSGAKHIVMCDSKGMIHKSRPGLDSNKYKTEIASITNLEDNSGSLSDALVGADIFIGVSRGNLVSQDMVRAMAKDSMIIAMANPTPEILPNLAREAGARIVATGRSDFPNQVNNVLAFPGIFRGALDIRATRITPEMKVAAAHALANMVEDPHEENILPYALSKDVVPVVAQAVKDAWLKGKHT